jgi:predicted aspartyl protease
MVIGKFRDEDPPLPIVPALISWDGGVQSPFFVLDTGFSGEIAVTKEMAKDLGLKFDTVIRMQTATGETKAFPAASALATMEGQTLYVTAVLVDGKPLLGITFMEKFSYTAIVDCKNKTAVLEVSK